MKKWMLAFLVALSLLLSLCACGGSGGAEQSGSPATWQEQYELGLRYVSEGDYEAAIIAFTAAIEIDPMQAEAYIGLADVYTAQGDTDKAMETLQQAMELLGENEAVSAALEKLRGSAGGETLTVLTYQAAYKPDGTICFSIRYFYNEAGYLIRSETRHYNENGEQSFIGEETWVHEGEPGHCWNYPPRSAYQTDEEWEAARMEMNIDPGTYKRYSSYGHICMWPVTREEVGEDGILENWNDNPDPSVMPQFDHAVYTFDEAGYPTAISTYGEDGALIGTATAEWEVLELTA